MIVELLGHATLLVRSREAVLLFDPVFFDPFEDGAVTSYPARVLDPSALPALDAVVLSHRHPDHLDPASLYTLPRQTPIFCPSDERLVRLVGTMGFRDVRVVEPAVPIAMKDLVLVPTASRFDEVPELGFVVQGAGGVVWNQVDTEVAPEEAAALAERYGPVDLHLARFACQNFDFFESRSTRFPLEEHLRNLAVAVELRARCIVPASAGFRFAAPHAWLNAFLFPVSPARFLSDLARLAPGLRGLATHPGDVGIGRANGSRSVKSFGIGPDS